MRKDRFLDFLGGAAFFGGIFLSAWHHAAYPGPVTFWWGLMHVPLVALWVFGLRRLFHILMGPSVDELEAEDRQARAGKSTPATLVSVVVVALLSAPALAQEIPKTDTPLVFKSVVRDVNVREFVLSPEEEVRFFKSNVTRLEREVVVAVLQTRMSMETEEDGSIVALLLRVKTETACYGFCFEPEVLEPPSCVVPLEMPKATAAVPARDGGFFIQK
ncbi:MAG: hypothetical protein AMXMBFR44_2120 [Candidatus Campbellbacteria bacterium]